MTSRWVTKSERTTRDAACSDAPRRAAAAAARSAAPRRATRSSALRSEYACGRVALASRRSCTSDTLCDRQRQTGQRAATAPAVAEAADAVAAETPVAARSAAADVAKALKHGPHMAWPQAVKATGFTITSKQSWHSVLFDISVAQLSSCSNEDERHRGRQALEPFVNGFDFLGPFVVSHAVAVVPSQV